tara:strand:+ start:3697 stop:5907 length:2211 start_codon:yes stop_codon:yes gene_type:complete
MFADISFPISSFQVFSYEIPPSLINDIHVGSIVNAPFSTRNIQGIVVDKYEEKKYVGNIKEIDSLVDGRPVIDKSLWKLTKWMSSYYNTPIGLTAKTVLPSKLITTYTPPSKNFVQLTDKSLSYDIKGSAQKKIYEYLQHHNEPLPVSDLKNLTPSALSACKALQTKGAVKLIKKPVVPNPYNLLMLNRDRKIILTNDQQKAIKQINNSLKKDKFDPFLLHGVTGSGKTEVFIESVKNAIKFGKSAIVLLPEISITPQIAGRFKSVFGDKVAVWHSKLTQSSRGWIWKKICEGDYKIIVGARSAIFSPLKNLGLIIVDEEQENAFKQSAPDPKYHAREVALMRGKINDCAVILSSATPSIESYYNYKNKKLKYLELPKRFGSAKLPKIHLIDMIEESKKTEEFGAIFSRFLLEKIDDRLKKNEQIILLHNRRGFAPVLRCNDCGDIILCPHCKLSLTYHKTDKKMKCHFCNHNENPKDKCFKCDSTNIQLGGTGTQKIESELKNIFHKASIGRLDLDSAPTASKITKTLEKFSNKEIDILIGTQMIAKGLDFSNATLVGITNADTGLFLPDFRSGEKTFQLIYQAAGRAGRGEKKGEVVIQSYNSENQIIQHASNLDLKTYYEQCLIEREELNYPPFSWLVRIEIKGKDREKVLKTINKLRAKLFNPPKGIEILGPAPCYRERLKDYYRMQIVIKSNKATDKSGLVLKELYKKATNDINFSNSLKLNIDVNPVSLL